MMISIRMALLFIAVCAIGYVLARLVIPKARISKKMWWAIVIVFLLMVLVLLFAPSALMYGIKHVSI